MPHDLKINLINVYIKAMQKINLLSVSFNNKHNVQRKINRWYISYKFLLLISFKMMKSAYFIPSIEKNLITLFCFNF